MPNYKRSIDIAAISSSNDGDSLGYNFQSGGHKNLPVGPHLLPIPTVVTGSPTWTTDVSAAATGLPSMGLNLAIYNKSATTYALTIGNTPSITAQAIGAFDSSGNAGIPCGAGWTYLSTGANQWIISGSTNLVVFIMEDSTKIVVESK